KPLYDLGALVAPVGSEWWRYLSAPFVYSGIGYAFVIGLALAIFGPGLERRLGSLPAWILLIACGALGMLAADGVYTADGRLLGTAGGNGVALGALACWLALRRAEVSESVDEDFDVIG